MYKDCKFVVATAFAGMMLLFSPAYADHGYNLVPVTEKGENTITRYEFNEETYKFVPHYYRLELVKTEYGAGDSTRHYEWAEYYFDGALMSVETPTEGKVTITEKYNESDVYIPRRVVTEPGNPVDIGDLNTDFVALGTEDCGGAVYHWGGTIGNIVGDFVGNFAAFYGGGAIDNVATIGNITGNFIGNSASMYGFGGAIDNSGVIADITGDFIGNTSANGGGAIRNGGTIGNITGDFIGNSGGDGGAIYNQGTLGDITGNFISNHSVRQGAAIWTNQDLNITANNTSSTFYGNYVKSGQDYQAIWVDKNNDTPATINFISTNHGTITMHDNINGVDGYTVNITGDNTGIFSLYNDIYNANVKLGNTTLNTINSDIHNYNFNSFTLSDNTNMSVDVDLSSKTMDRLSSPIYGTHTGTLNVSNMHLTSDAGRDFTAIYFAEPGLKNNVSTTINEVAYTPIYKYTVSYDNQNQYDNLGEGGYFLFTRGTGSTNPSDSFNPAVLTTPVSNVAASQSTVNETFKYVFEHADAFSQMPLVERMSYLNANKYALSTTYNENLGRIIYSQNNAAWLRPYTTFESINLKNGPKVDAITYGSLAGFDGNFKEMHHGWYRIGTGYLGYNGSQLNYHHNDTTMNGGLLGFTETFYKKNFWTALTLSAGASVGETRTMYGKEDFTTLLAGVGSKTGYNLEFQEGKYILQPIMFLSYTFVNTFDYTNASGTRISTAPAHSIQLNPSIRFISNFKNGWQPYASVGMVWNLMNSSDIRANGIKLPEMSMKPYVEYGLGLQRNWKERFTAFGQAMVRNGGRNGVALTFGFRWAIGKGGEDL